MNIADFEFYCDFLKKKSGLTLGSDKTYLLESRLTPIAKKWNHETIESLTKNLRGAAPADMIRDVVEAMTTNETSFFRDGKPFEIFKSVVMPYFLKTRQNKRGLRMWCAAASSGQEPYSLLMTMREMGAQTAGWNTDFLATDINHEILKAARHGAYSQFEVQRGLPIQMLMKYFEQSGDRWQIKEEIRRMVRYEYFNLLDCMAHLGTFDVIFCRNVLIYFDEKTKRDIMNRLAERLSADGFLFLGGAETVIGYTDAFRPHEGSRGLYILKNGQYNAEALRQAVA